MTGPHRKYDPHQNYTHYVQQHAGSKVKLDFHAYTAEHSASRLNADATDLGAEVKKIEAAPGAAFGLSALGQQVQHEATLAHGKLKGAVHLLAQALESYSTAVTTAKKTIIDADGDVDTSMSSIQSTLAAGDAKAQTPTAAAPTVKDAPPAPTDPGPTPPGPDSSQPTSSVPTSPFLPPPPVAFGPSPALQQIIDQLNQGGE